MRVAPFASLCIALVLSLPAHAQKVEVEEFTLPNGMQFLLVPRTDQPNAVTAGWIARVGSVNERPGITGISHFFEHMMFKGTNTIGTKDPAKDATYRDEQKAIRDEINRAIWTRQYDRFFRGEIDDPWNPANDTQELRVLRGKLDALIRAQQGRGDGGPEAGTIVKDEFDQVYTKAGGSGMNAFTSYDLTCYFITVPSNKLELWAWLEELALLQAAEIPERELRKVKNRVAAQNYRKLENNMSLFYSLAFSEALLDWREINEGPAKYEAVTAADIRRVANRYFKETNRSVATYRRKPD